MSHKSATAVVPPRASIISEGVIFMTPILGTPKDYVKAYLTQIMLT